MESGFAQHIFPESAKFETGTAPPDLKGGSVPLR